MPVKKLTAGQKAAKTRAERIAAMSPQQRAWVTIRRRKAAAKAVETRKANKKVIIASNMRFFIEVEGKMHELKVITE